MLINPKLNINCQITMKCVTVLKSKLFHQLNTPFDYFLVWCHFQWGGIPLEHGRDGFLLGFFAKSENYFRMGDAASLTGKWKVGFACNVSTRTTKACTFYVWLIVHLFCSSRLWDACAGKAVPEPVSNPNSDFSSMKDTASSPDCYRLLVVLTFLVIKILLCI